VGDANAIVNSNWHTIDGWFNPAEALTASQTGTTVTASAALFTSEMVGATIYFATGETGVIQAGALTGTPSTTCTLDVSQTIAAGTKFAIYRTGQDPKTAVARALLKTTDAASHTNGYVPAWNSAQQRFILQAGGEANTASNVGASGEGVFKEKVGVDLRFKKLLQGAGITITGLTDQIEIKKTVLDKLDATVDPTTGDDSGDGYAVGSLWVNVTSDTAFVCVDASVGSAVWFELVGRTASQTLTNKTLDNSTTITIKDNQLTIQRNTDVSRQVQFVLSNITPSTTRLIQFPNGDDTLLGQNTVNTAVKNKQFDSSNYFFIQDDGLVLQDPVTTTKKGRFDVAGVTAGNTRIMSFPDEDETLNNPEAGWKKMVRAATTANITLSGEQTIDGVSVVADDRVLVKDQTAATENGIYKASAGAWSRWVDSDADAELRRHRVIVREGTANGGKVFKNTNASAITIGATNIVYAEDTGSGETNTASNVGSAVGVFKQKTGVDLEFKSLRSKPGVTITGQTSEVDVGVGELGWKQIARVATTANITLSGEQTIDGVSAVAGDRALVKDQTTPAENGIYVVASGAWSRAEDADADIELRRAFITVREGTANAGKLYRNTNASAITVGVTGVTYSEFTGGGGGEANTASNVGTGTGLFKQKTGVDLEFKTILAGEGLEVSGGTNEVTIKEQSGNCNRILECQVFS